MVLHADLWQNVAPGQILDYTTTFRAGRCLTTWLVPLRQVKQRQHYLCQLNFPIVRWWRFQEIQSHMKCLNNIKLFRNIGVLYDFVDEIPHW